MSEGLSIRFIRQWQPESRERELQNDMALIFVGSAPDGPWPGLWSRIRMPLAGHRGDCAKVTTATVLGTLDAECTCGAKK